MPDGKEGYAFYRVSVARKPLPLGEVALRSNDGEGKPGTKEPLRSDGQALCQRETSAAPVLPRQQPCPLRRFAPALPKGEPLAFRKALSLRQRLPYKGQQRRPPPVAEAGSRCWGSGQQDASEALRMLGAATRPWRAQARLRGCTKARLHLFRSICTSAPPLTGWAV